VRRTLLVVVLLATSVLAYERLQGPTELLFHDPERAFDGYTLFGVGNRTYLLDMKGRVVHTWPVGTNPHPAGQRSTRSTTVPSRATS
jgi:hypothetical protein